MRLAAGLLAGIAAGPLHAQRSTENALQAAEDAFGTSIGRENIGLYGTDDVRGFSAVDAGNVRLEDLYFDPVTLPSPILRSTTTIRVGIAAQGFAFPAPSGVVDIRLRRPARVPGRSLFASADTFGFLVSEATADVRFSQRVGAALGAGAYRERYGNGTTDWIASGSATFEWKPTETIEVVPFVSYVAMREAQSPPDYITAGEYLPPRVPRLLFTGPEWAENSRNRYNFGVIFKWQEGGWRLRAGLFRSVSNARASFANLYLDVTPDATASQLIVTDPPARNGSTSGELRLDRAFGSDVLRHTLTLSLRGRLRERLFGGSQFVDLGRIAIGAPQPAPRPDRAFGAQDLNQIRQGTIAAGYALNWRGGVNLNLGLQKTGYRQHAVPGNGAALVGRSSPVLLTATGSLRLSERISAYASYAEGLEDSGAAPGSATNRNAPLPASRTRQYDIGLRWKVKPDLSLVLGAYDLSRPYFQFDPQGAFSQLGSTANRGIEVSLSGAITPRLDVVGGAIIGDSKVRGSAVEAGLVGTEAVGRPDRRFNLAFDWRPPLGEGVTLSLGVRTQSSIVATSSNAVRVPARTLFDAGVRYGFRLGELPAQARLSATNLADTFGWDVFGSGVYGFIDGRAVQLSLGIDF
ncbi:MULTISPECIES: TonB-dependent receptor domain-containing protein [unclassified Sphingomonas]|uniref:TonB-dependent receptor domain-containing protein n=1 Tax=unclassified Sphingomonas TaxID=196159 RepID=UPI00082C0FAC|nr:MULTISPECIES: TonB-dependent receptor [unclassified Sphingomonas]